jgi:hypothetical protein
MARPVEIVNLVDTRWPDVTELFETIGVDLSLSVAGDTPAQNASGDLTLDPNANPPSNRLKELLVNYGFKAVWGGKRKGFSPSHYDASADAQAARAGWSHQERADLTIALRRKLCARPEDVRKALRPDYISRTQRQTDKWLAERPAFEKWHNKTSDASKAKTLALGALGEHLPLLTRDGGSTTDFAVLSQMVWYSDTGREVEVPRKQLSKDIDCAPRTITSSVARLDGLDCIDIARRGAGRRAPVYLLHPFGQSHHPPRFDQEDE